MFPQRLTGSKGESLERGGGDLSSGPDPGRVSAGPDPLRSGLARSGQLGEDLWLRPRVRVGRSRRVRRWEWEIVGEGKGALEGGLLVAKGMRRGPGCRVEAEVRSDPGWPALARVLAGP